MIDLSHNETCTYLALALEGKGLPQGLTRPLAIYAVDQGLIHQALNWDQADLPNLIQDLAAADAIRPSRQSLPLNLWQRIKTLAAQTYVPESETSKHSGAGAGVSDND